MRGKVLTIPNILTIARLIFLYPFVHIAIESPITGAWIAAVLAFTDFLDGWIARKFNQESPLGRILDPISDRALFIVTFVVFLKTDSLPVWFVIVVGLRELIVTFGTIFIAYIEKIRLDVNKIGKTSAFAAMAATPAWVLHNETNGTISIVWFCVASISSIIAIPTGYISIYQYGREFLTIKRTKRAI